MTPEEAAAHGEDPNPIDDSVKYCPDCERPNQFGELCPNCLHDREIEQRLTHTDYDESQS